MLDTVPEAHDFFRQLALPVPDEDEHYSATGFRKLVFLSDYGIVIRMTPANSIMQVSNPHFLEPIFTRSAGGYQFAIDPGIDCTATWKEARAIYKYLNKKYGIHVSDGKPQNLGFVPDGTRRHPVLIDLDPTFTSIDRTQTIQVNAEAAARLNGTVRLLSSILKLKPSIPEMPADYQDGFYKPLKEAAAAMWPSNSNVANPEKTREFFSLCTAFKEAGKLLSTWTRENNNYHGTTQVAHAYAERLRQQNGPG